MLLQKKTSKKTVAQKSSSSKKAASSAPVMSGKPVKTYKGLCLFLISFLFLEAFALMLVHLKYDVCLEEKISYQEKLQRQKLKAYHNYLENKNPAEVLKQHAQRSHLYHAQKKASRQKASQSAPQNKAPCPKPVPRKAKYIESQYAPYAAGGQAKIQGKACFTLNDGSQKCIAGLDIYINPVTDYSNEWYQRGWLGTEYLEIADSRVVPFNKSVKTDKNGNFSFEGLAPGSYYVVTQLCLPYGKNSKKCEYRRYGTQVTMKNLVHPTLKQLFPKVN